MSMRALTALASISSAVLVLATPLGPYAGAWRAHTPRQAPCSYTCPATAVSGTALSFQTTSTVEGNVTCIYGTDSDDQAAGSTGCGYAPATGAQDTTLGYNTGNCPATGREVCACTYFCPEFDLAQDPLSSGVMYDDGAEYNGDLLCQYQASPLKSCYYNPGTGTLDPAFTSDSECQNTAQNTCSGNATLSCPIGSLQCCGSLNLASEPAVANGLGLEGLTIPGPDVTVGFNCSAVGAFGEPLTASCLGRLSCCESVGLGIDADISEGCSDATINDFLRPAVPRSEGARAWWGR